MGASRHSVLVRIDTDSGERTVIADDPGADLWSPGDRNGRFGGRLPP